MFSGIVQGSYPITSLTEYKDHLHYAVSLPLKLSERIELGASIAVDGVCQTVVAQKTQGDACQVFFDAIEETLQKTTLSSLHLGRKVHIERALTYGAEIGGHLLSGHVFGKALVKKVHAGKSTRSLDISCNPHWLKYILPKGFIALDGASLTVNAVHSEGFTVHLIPETLRLTHFQNKAEGDFLNIEFDTMTQCIVDTVEHYLKQTLRN
ncbi:MAG: riboflavin synthase alpha chain [Chlamydiales bacterium]|jgi:riboflavin synthase|nr:riboflavin synthase alpha chain [Chlamydiales bacterium]